MTTSRKQRGKRLSKTRLDRLVVEAIVDCYNESEQVTGLYTMIEGNLALPFETMVLGVQVTVERVDLTQREEIVALCRRAGVRQTVPILDLPLPSRRPAGSTPTATGWAADSLVFVPRITPCASSRDADDHARVCGSRDGTSDLLWTCGLPCGGDVFAIHER